MKKNEPGPGKPGTGQTGLPGHGDEIAALGDLIARRRGQMAIGPRTRHRSLAIWGLTGGVASGKSTAARIFSELGFVTIDADQISRELSSPGAPAWKPILERFGTGDRAELRKIIFNDPAARRDLEAILHPLIQAETMQRTRKALEERPELQRADGSMPVIYEAALLVETGRHADFDGLIVIEAPMSLRLERLLSRDGISRELAEKMIAAQATDQARREVASRVILNDGTPEDLSSRIHEFVRSRGWVSGE